MGLANVKHAIEKTTKEKEKQIMKQEIAELLKGITDAVKEVVNTAKAEGKEVVKAAARDVLARGTMSKMLPHGGANVEKTPKTGATETPKAGGKDTPKPPDRVEDDKTQKIWFGGAFDNSDEEAFGGLIAKMGDDPTMAGAAVKVSRFLNDECNFTPKHKEKFRAIVGSLGRLEFTATDGKNKNQGVEFMRTFVKCSEAEMLEICRADGVMDSAIDRVRDGLTHLGQDIAKTAKAIEQSPAAQTVMVSLADRMHARIAKIRNPNP